MALRVTSLTRLTRPAFEATSAGLASELGPEFARTPSAGDTTLAFGRNMAGFRRRLVRRHDRFVIRHYLLDGRRILVRRHATGAAFRSIERLPVPGCIVLQQIAQVSQAVERHPSYWLSRPGVPAPVKIDAGYRADDSMPIPARRGRHLAARAKAPAQSACRMGNPAEGDDSDAQLPRRDRGLHDVSAI